MKLKPLLAFILAIPVIVLFLTSCFKKKPGLVDAESSSLVEPIQLDLKPKIEKAVQIGHLNKSQREMIHFASSLEKEALRLITQLQYEKGTLFSALSYVLETDAGMKKMFPQNLECSRHRIEKKENRLFVYRTCQKPEILIAEVGLANEELDVEFKTREWRSVIGTSVALTNPDIRCQLKMINNKLEIMNCFNWTYLVNEDQISSTEIRLKTFSFNRSNPQQLELKGGFYKDLVENKKISVLVPLSGQIKIFEKELEVIDDFAEKPKQEVDLKKIQLSNKLKPLVRGAHHGEESQSQDQSQDQSNNQEGQAINSESQSVQSEDQSSGQAGENGEGSESGAEETQREIEQNTEVGPESGGVPKTRTRGR